MVTSSSCLYSPFLCNVMRHLGQGRRSGRRCAAPWATRTGICLLHIQRPIHAWAGRHPRRTRRSARLGLIGRRRAASPAYRGSTPHPAPASLYQVYDTSGSVGLGVRTPERTARLGRACDVCVSRHGPWEEAAEGLMNLGACSCKRREDGGVVMCFVRGTRRTTEPTSLAAKRCMQCRA